MSDGREAADVASRHARELMTVPTEWPIRVLDATGFVPYRKAALDLINTAHSHDASWLELARTSIGFRSVVMADAGTLAGMLLLTRERDDRVSSLVGEMLRLGGLQPNDVFHCDALVVDSARQGGGAATALVRRAIGYGREVFANGFGMTAWIHPNNTGAAAVASSVGLRPNRLAVRHDDAQLWFGASPVWG